MLKILKGKCIMPMKEKIQDIQGKPLRSQYSNKKWLIQQSMKWLTTHLFKGKSTVDEIQPSIRYNHKIIRQSRELHSECSQVTSHSFPNQRILGSL